MWFLVLICAVLVIVVLVHETQQGRFQNPGRSQREWAEELLPADSYRITRNKYRVERIELTREVTVQGVPCRADSEIQLGRHGRLQRARLARDVTVSGLRLSGDTEVAFDHTEGHFVRGTLRSSTVIGGIPCAPGPITITGRRRRQVLSATLGWDADVAGVPCRGGTKVRLHEGIFRERVVWPTLIACTPRVELTRWGLRCAADHLVDFERRSGTLAADHVGDGIRLPKGSRFGFDLDWDDIWVQLSQSIELWGFRIPAGGTVFPPRRVLFPRRRTGPIRWLFRSWEGRLQVAAYASEPWKVGGLDVATFDRVIISPDGLARLRLPTDRVANGVRYPRGSRVAIDVDGRIHWWEAGPPPHREPEAGPYR